MGDRLRAIVVDDEEPARHRLKALLEAVPDVAVVAEASDGEQALERIAELKPDVVFLDIALPGCSGLDVAGSLGTPCPAVVFCTAFDDHAVDAFELAAVDYLLKPVSRARLAASLTRVRERGPRAAAPGSHAGYPHRFLGKRANRYHVVSVAEVVYFASEQGLSRLHTANAYYWLQPSLNDLEARLDPERFFRVSRAAIVALDAIRELVPNPGGHGTLKLSCGVDLEVSRRRLPDLMARLGGR